MERLLLLADPSLLAVALQQLPVARVKVRNSIPLVVGIHNGRKHGVFIGTTIRGGPVLNSTETVAPETASIGMAPPRICRRARLRRILWIFAIHGPSIFLMEST